MTYKKYDPKIKKMIVESGCPDLFPELEIPRSTALYWIKSSKDVHSNIVDLKGVQKFSSLKNENLKLKAEVYFLRSIFKIFFNENNIFSTIKNHKKEAIVKLVDKMRGALSVTYAMKLIGGTADQYYRWRVQVKGCERTLKRCDVTRPNQLSLKEQQEIIKLASSQSYSHMSIKSLMYHSQRKGVLYCGYDSWLKYIKVYNIKRSKIRKPKKNVRIGIRAKKPFKIWHIDISEITILNKEKFYLQMVVDNYSRAIMGWNISNRKDLSLSLSTIRKSITSNTLPENMMSDGGKENLNQKVTKLLLGKGIRQLIAKTDVPFSNSMIEAVFKNMKGVINFQKIKNEKSLKNKIKWYVYQYNHVIPHSQLKGALPIELINSSFDELNFKNFVNEKRDLIKAKRVMEYQQCRVCLGEG